MLFRSQFQHQHNDDYGDDDDDDDDNDNDDDDDDDEDDDDDDDVDIDDDAGTVSCRRCPGPWTRRWRGLPGSSPVSWDSPQCGPTTARSQEHQRGSGP